jgi:hypothetical protein
VFMIAEIGRKLFEKLLKRPYRHSYMAEHVRRGIAYQLRALRDQHNWKQGEFAKQLGKPQSVVCRLEDPSYGKVTIQTLLEVASVYDVALQVRFVTYSTFLSQTRDLSTQSMMVPNFTQELTSAYSAYHGALLPAIEATRVVSPMGLIKNVIFDKADTSGSVAGRITDAQTLFTPMLNQQNEDKRPQYLPLDQATLGRHLVAAH